MKGVTKTGFEFEIDDKVLDDYEVLELFADVAEDGVTAALASPKLLKRLLGTEQVKRLKDHVRGEDGIVSQTAMFAEIEDVLTGEAKTKN